MEKANIKEQLLTKNTLNLMFQLAVPAIIGMIAVGLYPLMDGIFAGNIIGQKAMTAIGVATPMTFINSGIATLLGIGSASVLSRAIGRNDKETVKRLMGNLFFWVLTLSIIVTSLGILFCTYYFSLVDATAEIKELAVRYIRIIFIGSFFVNFTQSTNMILRGQGLMKTAMLIMGLGALVNIILDPILMATMGEHAIEGAAIATFIAQVLQSIITIIYFTKKASDVKLRFPKLDSSITKEVFAVGVSAMLMQVLSILQQTLLYRQAFVYGSETSGIIMAVCMRMISFTFIPLWGMSQGLQPAVGTNFGAKKFDRVKQIMKTFCIAASILAAIFYIPSMLFTDKLLLLFGVEANVINIGVLYFRTFYCAYITYGIMIMTMTYFQSIGDGKSAGIIAMLRQVFLFVPIVLLLPKFFGSFAVWYSSPLVDTIVISICLISLRKSFKKDLLG